MAQIFGDKLLMFHVSTVDSNSVTNADDGTNIDLAAFPAKNISSIAAENNGSGLVYIYFTGGTKYEPGMMAATTEQDSDDTTAMVNIFESMEQAFVRVTCTSGKEAAVIEDLWVAMNSVSAGPVLKFDAVNSVYPIENITGLQVRRHVTTHTIASDS
tara:strand:+ start:24 stop:494 length:471 start_codon:yes stop_codon:yes gene_type:complete